DAAGRLRLYQDLLDAIATYHRCRPSRPLRATREKAPAQSLRVADQATQRGQTQDGERPYHDLSAIRRSDRRTESAGAQGGNRHLVFHLSAPAVGTGVLDYDRPGSAPSAVIGVPAPAPSSARCLRRVSSGSVRLMGSPWHGRQATRVGQYTSIRCPSGSSK